MAAPATYARRQFPGAAIATTITSPISDSATECTLAATTGWPTGAYTGGVLCEFYSLASESTLEKVWATNLGGSTLTIVRAADGTAAAAIASGSGIRPIAGAVDANEANYVVAETVGKATAANQYLVSDGANSFAALPAYWPVETESGSFTVDLDTWHVLTTAGNTTVTDPTPPNDSRVHESVIEVTNAGTHTLTLPGAWEWTTATPPEMAGKSVIYLRYRFGVAAQAFLAGESMAVVA